MPAGLEIIGGPAINQDSKVMLLASKINSSAMSSFNGGYQWTAIVPLTGCVYAISPSVGNGGGAVMVSSFQESGGSTTVTIASTIQSTNFDLYVFKQGGGAAVTGAGLEMFNSDGSLGFGSNFKPLKVLNQITYGDDASTMEQGPYAEPPSYYVNFPYKRVACIVSTHARFFDGDGTLVSGNFPYYAPRFVNNATTGDCALHWFPIGNIGKDLPGWARPGRYMFIDVTNY